MKKSVFFLGLLTAAGIASAECYVRTATNLTGMPRNTPPMDIQKLVTPDARGQKCVMRYRIHIDRDWQTAEGIGYGATEAEACAQALDLRRGSLLSDPTPIMVRSDHQMVCSDLPDIRVRPVRVGELIWESETELHTIESEKRYFWYKRVQCRMFVERDSKRGNLTLYQGVICRNDNSKDSKWRVIDKY